jgi:hypothetical protein
MFSPSWEAQFPLSSLATKTAIGSDHTPLILSSGISIPPRSNRFFFENAWISSLGFHGLVENKWLSLLDSPSHCRDPIDLWIKLSEGLHKFLKGWGANQRSFNRRNKDVLLQQIQELDLLANNSGLDDEGWSRRYHLEEHLMAIHRDEEEFWHQHGRLKWVLQGDANTKYFHAIANGRRRKCLISALVAPEGRLINKAAIQVHIYQFYRDLMGVETPHVLTLAQDIWPATHQISLEENEAFSLSFLP